MLTLHAKSSWDNPGLADYDRPLGKRGQSAAPRMGSEIAAGGLRPDLVLCSGARRTRETLALVLDELGKPIPEIVYDDTIYMGTPKLLLALLRKLPSGAGAPKTVMIVGHNPGLEDFAAELAAEGDSDARNQMAQKFPTGALAVLAFDETFWTDVAPGKGDLVRFLTPASLT
jgi:phosphohistidine phosphatase